jgi:hypothetical protein
MSKTICTSVFLVLLSCVTMAQKSKGGAASPAGSSTTPPGSSGPASATGTQQTGYVYRLPWRYHIRYGSVHYRLADSLVQAAPAAGNVTSTTKRTIKVHQPKGIGGTVEIHQKHDKVPEGALEDADITIPKPLNVPANSTVTYITIDSVSRYWDRPVIGIHSWYLPWNWLRYLYRLPSWFTRYRLRVSVTEADSGKLQLGMYERGFQPSAHPYDGKYIDLTQFIRGDSVADDYAIPIGASDTAQNFYLQIDNKILASQPISYIQLRYASTQYGAMAVPFKYRFAPKHTQIYVAKPQSTRYASDTVVSAPSESTGSINLALFFGRKWGYTRFYFDQSKTHNTVAVMLSAFAGASLIPISVSNVKYPKDADSLSTQAIAFSFGGALSLEWRGIDLGIFSGADYTSNKFGWIYNKKIWIGFGIGVNLGMFTSGPTQVQL